MSGRAIDSLCGGGFDPQRKAEAAMEKRVLGRTGLTVSVLGFGCGAVGGLMVRGAPADQERAVARAVERGIDYFDTAAMYGNGESERNLGRVLKSLRPDIRLGTKVRVPPVEPRQIGAAIAASLQASLERLQKSEVDLFQLHNHITRDGADGDLTPELVLGEVVPAFERLKREGKARFCGLTAVGDTGALFRVVDGGAFDTAQVSYNMLNPSAGATLAVAYPAHDFGNLFTHTRAATMGVIAIRVLAAGALSGLETRHPLGSPNVEPIGSGSTYRIDVARARRLMPLVAEGFVEDLIEAAIRFTIANEAVSTALVGTSTLEEFEHAAAAAEKGPLPRAALDRLAALQQGFVGEAR
jgi:L-galactose dehydrogenase/L-glyceraldehyde 3-phosphate reductase